MEKVRCTLFLQTLQIIVVLFSSYTIVDAQQWSTPLNLRELNSSADDFAPSWNYSDSLLIFNSTRTGKSRYYKTQNVNANPTIWGVLSPDSTQRQSSGSYSTFSKNNYCVLSKFRKIKNQVQLNLYDCKNSNGIWSAPELISSCSSNDFTSHPTVSPSGSTLVFSSSRKGGEGKCDLWMCKHSSIGWSQPINIGESVNSAGNEITPFLASDDTLYFSSDGLGGRGGYEIYYTTLTAGEWQQPLPISELNTNYDESDFILLPNNVAIFASNRSGGNGGLDLYVTGIETILPPSKSTEVECTISFQQPEIVVEKRGVIERKSIQPVFVFRDDFPLEFETLQDGFISSSTPLLELQSLAELINNQQPVFVITGYSNGSKSSTQLAEQRIQLLTDYLNKNSKLPKSSKTSIVTTDNTSLLRSVEFQFKDSSLFKAIEQRHQVNEVLPSELTLITDVRPRDKVKSWELDMSSSEFVSKIDAGDKNRLPAPIRIPLLKFNDSFSNVDSVQFVLKVQTMEGNYFQSTQGIPVRQRASKYQQQNDGVIVDCTVLGNSIYRFQTAGVYSPLLRFCALFNTPLYEGFLFVNESEFESKLVKDILSFLPSNVSVKKVASHTTTQQIHHSTESRCRLVIKQK